MKKVTLILVGILLLVAMTGCGKNKVSITAEDVTTNTIVIKKDSTIQSSIVEAFDKEYYSQDELEVFIKEEINDYNKKNGENEIEMHSIHVADQKASVVFNYNDIDDYSTFNGIDAKLLTTSQALQDEKITSMLEFVDSKNGGTVSKETALSNSDAMVLVIKQALDIKIDGTILYYTNVEKTDKNVLQSNEENVAVIVFSKKK
ncbi:hypothetical protein [Anaerosporobacter sp.]|uniref:hypothetical protein n=1 Tax=Anaerosporobacter sp. TaxID=1872529 RepID=UPI00286F4D8F|nr:hypothetical protein [Anaerosporobacter sp.]